MIIDAWVQHPTLRHARDPMFDSLRRWSRQEAPSEELPLKATIGSMDEAGIAKSLISAWVAPRNVLISNDEVAAFVDEYPDRLIGLGSVDISKPMAAVTEIRRCINVYIDTSAYTVSRYPSQIIQYIKTNGKKKVLFGSNYPMITPEEALRGLETLDLTREVQELFLAENAIRVFSLSH